MKGKRRKGLPFYLILLIIISFCLVIAGYLIYVIKDIPSITALKHLKNKPVSTIYDINDRPTYLVVPDNKIYIQYKRIPKHVKDAFLAAEDADFFRHGGVELQSIIRALIKNIIYGRVVQGGSTITQQVIKTLVLDPERSMVRKLREAILAYRLEKYLTKEEILNLYLNNIYMGHGVYGVEAASQIYFGKHIWEVSRAEAALLAGIIQAPARYTPKRHPGNARIRQEYVIGQMFEKGMIDANQKERMLKERIAIREDNGMFTDNHFKSYIIQYIEERYGKGCFSRNRLSIYTTIDRDLQRLAEEAVKRGIGLYEQRNGEYMVLDHVERPKWDNFINEMAKDLNLLPLVKGKTYRLLVSEMIKDGYHVFIGRDRGILRMDQSPFKPGDIVQGIYTGLDKMKTHTFRPIKGSKIEAALISMEVNTGYVIAMVGGRDFEKSPYNRAIFAKVQPGSAFKPFIYLTALKKGYEPDSTILDEPLTYSMGGGRTWTPKNYDGQYSGPITLKDAIAYSKNAATVRLLEEVGLDALRQTIEELGLDIDLQNNLSVALGTANTTLLDLVKGFATFANDGYRVRPIFVRRVMDGSGNLLEETGVEKVSVIPEEIARKMNLLLKGPVEYGTAKAAARLGYPVAGKTGTTSNYCDALFIGYSPHIATGVWAGFDSRASLGRNESGAKVCLPIWMSFMGSALRRYPPDDFAPPYESNTYPWPGMGYPH